MAVLGRWWIVPLALACFVFLPRLGVCPLWDDDEAFFAAAAQEMYSRGDLVTPTFNGELFSHKPPMMFWGMMLGFDVFGVNEFAARLPSVLWGLAAVLGVGLLSKRILCEDAGVWAACILASSLMFVVVARAATPDSALVACCTLSMAAAAKSFFSRDGRLLGAKLTGRSWWVCYALMGLAVLVKGPIGILLPAGSLLTFNLWQRLAEARPNGSLASWFTLKTIKEVCVAVAPAFKDLGLIRGSLLAGLIASPWFVAVTVATEGAWLREFLGVHNFGRFLQPMERHSGGPFYYVAATLVGFFPWSCFTLPILWETRPGQDANRSAAHRFLYAWLVVVFGFFSIAATKLPSYVLPAYPALAALGASYFHKLQLGRTGWASWPKWGFASLAAVGLGLCVAMPIVASIYLRGDLTVCLIGGVVLAFGAAGCYIAWTNRLQYSALVMAAASLVTMSAIFHVAAPRVAALATAPRLAEKAREQLRHGGRLVSYCYREPSLTYYSQAFAEKVQTEDGLLDSMKAHAGQPLVVAALASSWDNLSETTRAEFTTVASYRRFLQDEEILLLVRAPEHEQLAQGKSNSELSVELKRE